MIVGVGIDCEDIGRWAGLSKDTVGDSRYSLFSVQEHDYCSSGAVPAQHYAGRWCLKEATVKALAGGVSITTRDVEIEHVPHGNPRISLKIKLGIPNSLSLMASISHSETTAAAVVIAQVQD